MNIEPDSYMRIIDNLHDGLYYTDRKRVIRYWNKAAERITGYSASEVIGSACSDNILVHVDADGNNLCKGMCPLADTMEDGKPREVDVYLHHKKGHRIPVSVRVNPLTDNEGTIIGGVELFTDIRSREANELRIKELERLALLDELTQLANRRYVETELRNLLAEKKRFHVPLGILFMDIDHFKSVNDTYGHDAGDEVLKMTADTLVSNARPFDLYGRWGGEEFIGVLRNLQVENLEEVANRIRLLIEKSYIEHNGEQLSVTISMGATMVKDEDSLETLIKRADGLLYQSKNNGRNLVTVGE